MNLSPEAGVRVSITTTFIAEEDAAFEKECRDYSSAKRLKLLAFILLSSRREIIVLCLKGF
jgi:hypothetical protein